MFSGATTSTPSMRSRASAADCTVERSGVSGAFLPARPRSAIQLPSRSSTAVIRAASPVVALWKTSRERPFPCAITPAVTGPSAALTACAIASIASPLRGSRGQVDGVLLHGPAGGDPEAGVTGLAGCAAFRSCRAAAVESTGTEAIAWRVAICSTSTVCDPRWAVPSVVTVKAAGSPPVTVIAPQRIL